MVGDRAETTVTRLGIRPSTTIPGDGVGEHVGHPRGLEAGTVKRSDGACGGVRGSEGGGCDEGILERVLVARSDDQASVGGDELGRTAFSGHDDGALHREGLERGLAERLTERRLAEDIGGRDPPGNCTVGDTADDADPRPAVKLVAEGPVADEGQPAVVVGAVVAGEGGSEGVGQGYDVLAGDERPHADEGRTGPVPVELGAGRRSGGRGEQVEVDAAVDHVCPGGAARDERIELLGEPSGIDDQAGRPAEDQAGQCGDPWDPAEVGDVGAVGHQDEWPAGCGCGREAGEAGGEQHVGKDDIGPPATGLADGVAAEFGVLESRAAAVVDHRAVNCVAECFELGGDRCDEATEVWIGRPRPHLADDQDPHRSPISADAGSSGTAGCRGAGCDNPIMQMRTIGRTGIMVSPLCLGAMMFGAWGNPDHEESVRIIHRALDAGINFIDTADVYSAGESERIVGKALSGGRREHVVLATKAHASMGKDPNQRGNSRRWITRAVEDSLRRLETDWIDLYQIHRPEPDTDIDETLGALSDLVRQGKVRAIGSSTFPASQIVEAQWVAERRVRERFVCEQPPYSMLVRAVEADVLPTCGRHGMGVIGWSPLAGGWLSGKYRRGAGEPASSRAARLPGRYDLSLPGNQRKLDAADALAGVAEAAGITLIEMAIAFVMRHPAVTAPIIGPRTMEQLDSQLTAAGVVLTDDVLDRIDEIVPPGTNLDANDGGWQDPALEPAARRRPA